MPDITEVLRARLTPKQFDAAVDPHAEVLTLACAGSGKSRTLAFRIAQFISQGAPPSSIVSFTFTEKAAEAIKRNVARALIASELDPNVLGAIYIGTIHSYCRQILGSMDARYRQFEVLDENKMILYLMSRYNQLGIQVLRQNRGQLPYFKLLRSIVYAWSISNDEMVSLEQIRERDEILGTTLLALRDGLDHDNYIDFSLMIRLVVEALEHNDAGARRAIANLRHLLVDEYQDVNTAQERLIRNLHALSSSLFVVGDDDQSIYGWRGADVTNILRFCERYPDAMSHTLAKNFRSTPAIVAAADIFAAAQLGANRLEKNPEAASAPLPRDFRVLWFNDRAGEANWVAQRIQNLLGTEYRERDGTVRGLTPGDFAILMRSTKEPEGESQTPRHAPFTNALEQRGIQASLEAGGSPFDIPEVDALRATFELLRNESPTRTICQNHFAQIILPCFPNADFNSFANVMATWGREIHTPAGGPRRRVYPQNLVHELLDAFRISSMPLSEPIMRALGLFSRVIQDVEAVYLSIDSQSRFSELLNFLANVAQDGYDLSSDDIVRTPDAVTVSTVHKMKGLEFPVVFLVDVESQRFPKNRRQYDGWVPAELIRDPLQRGCYSSNHSEEARLFYTAVTRAERYLYVTGSANLPGARRAKQRSVYTRQLNHEEVLTVPDGLPAGLVQAPQRPRIDDADLPTSYSEIRYYLRCPRDYQFRKSFGFSPAIVEMFGFGHAVHAAVGKLHELYPQAPPTPQQAEAIAREMFHLKHIPPSRDPINRPGGYERARDSSANIARTYVESYGDDFRYRRQLEVAFEVPISRAVISGAIDLLIRENPEGRIVEASIVDFKAMRGEDEFRENESLHWTELALQVQLYAKAAREVLGEGGRTGAVHFLKDNQRIAVPVDNAAVDSALQNVEWAVERILAHDFPMRPERSKCESCDFNRLCSKQLQQFTTNTLPPPIHIPDDNVVLARCFSQLNEA